MSHLHLKDNSQFKSVIHQQFLSVICGAKLKIQYWHEELFFAGVKCWFTIWILADSEACQVLEGMYFPLVFWRTTGRTGAIFFLLVVLLAELYNYNITFFQVIVMIKPLLLSPEKVCDSVNPSIRHPTKNSFKYIPQSVHQHYFGFVVIGRLFYILRCLKTVIFLWDANISKTNLVTLLF